MDPMVPISAVYPLSFIRPTIGANDHVSVEMLGEVHSILKSQPLIQPVGFP